MGSQDGARRTVSPDERPYAHAIQQVLISWNLPFLDEDDVIQVANATAPLLTSRHATEARVRDVLAKPSAEDQKAPYSSKVILQQFECATLLVANCVFVQTDLDALETQHAMNPGDAEIMMRRDDQITEVHSANLRARAALQQWVEVRNQKEYARNLVRFVRARVEDKGWTKEDLVREAGISPSTAYNLMTTPMPGRRWRPSITKLVEDALNWERGSFETILKGGQPVLVSGPPHFGDLSVTADENAPDSRLLLRLDSDALDLLRGLAILEARSPSALASDAVRLYAATHYKKPQAQ